MSIQKDVKRLTAPDIRARKGGDPVVMLTSLGNRLDAEIMKSAGIAACLIKPVKQSRLFDTLASVVAASAPALPTTPERAVQSPSPSDEQCHPVRSVRILLAEDNMVNQRLAIRQLRKLGYSADAVGNGLEVLQALQNTPYDVLLLDCQMPELDGYETARRIRQGETRLSGANAASRPPLRIVAMTANAMHGDREKCLAAGMDDYVSKPVRLPDLEAALARSSAHWPSNATPPVPAPLAPDDPDAVDLTSLRSLRELSVPGDVDPLVEMVDLFLTDTGPLVDRMRTAQQTQDWTTVQKLSHSLKGSASNMGARRLAGLCARLEKSVRAGEAGQSDELLPAITTEFARLREILLRERNAPHDGPT